MNISQIIVDAMQNLTEQQLISFAEDMKSGKVSIPNDVDKELLRAGRNNLERLLDDSERRNLRRSFKDVINNRSETENGFELEVPGRFSVKSSGSGNVVTGVLAGGALVLATAVLVLRIVAR